MSAVKQCLSILPEALLIALTLTQGEKKRVKTGIRECQEQWSHMDDRADANSAAGWGDTGVCRIQGRRRCDGLRGAG